MIYVLTTQATNKYEENLTEGVLLELQKLGYVFTDVTTRMQMGPLQIKWLDSLRRNGHRQCKGQLGVRLKDDYEACCLGEYLIVAELATFDSNGELLDVDSKYALYDSYEKLGLYSSDGANVIGGASLATLNDGGLPWHKIADIIESAPQHYFTKSV